MQRKIIPYHPRLKAYARELRNNSTRSEIRLWQHLSGKQMMGYDFHRQKPIDLFICDFFCHELMLSIELDGITHYSEEGYLRDARKDKRLNALGIAVLRFHDEEVMNDIDNVLRTIEGFIEEKQEHTPAPLKRGNPELNP